MRRLAIAQKGVIHHAIDGEVFGNLALSKAVGGMTVEAKTVSGEMLARKLRMPAKAFTAGPYPITNQRLQEDGSVEVLVSVHSGVLSVPMTFAEYTELPEMDFPEMDSPIWGSRMKR